MSRKRSIIFVGVALLMVACSRAPETKPAPKADVSAKTETPMPSASEVESAYRSKLAEASKELGIQSEVSGFLLQSCAPAGTHVRCEASMTMTVNGETASGVHSLLLARSAGGFVLTALPGMDASPTNAISVIQK